MDPTDSGGPTSSDAHRGPGGQRPGRVWHVRDLLLWTEGRFRELGISAARLEAELLLAHAMEISRLDLYLGYEKVVEVAERARFRRLVERRSRREPVAYLLGRRDFYALEFEVEPAVLIPRPETEVLVEAVLARLSREDTAVRILDLGTGSGNIAVALAVHLPHARAWAVDLSPDALAVARRNAEAHGVAGRIEFLCGDLFGALAEPASPPGGFDAIVSNPPYVAAEEQPRLMPDVRDYEPAMALVDRREGSGTGFHRVIAGDAQRYANDGCLLALEIDPSQATAVAEMLGAAGWCDPSVLHDGAGLARVVLAHWREGTRGSGGSGGAGAAEPEPAQQSA